MKKNQELSLELSLKTILLLLVIISVAGCGSDRTRSSIKNTEKQQEYAKLPMKGIKQTTLEEAIRCKAYYKKYGDFSLAAKYLEHALRKAIKNHTQRAELMLELADLYMDLGERSKAAILFREYRTLFPGSPSIKHVCYQEIKALFAESLISCKDQTKTHEALKLAQKFFEEFPEDTEYAQDIKNTVQDCYIKLMKYEYNIARFYLKKYGYSSREGAVKAAHKRIDYLLQEYAVHVSDAQELLKLREQIVLAPIDAYVSSLDLVLISLEAYFLEHGAIDDGWVAALV